MADQLKEQKESDLVVDDLSGGMQIASTDFQRKANELGYAENADYGVVGGIGKTLGYAQRASDLTSTTSTSTSTSTTTTSTSTSTSTSTTTTA